MNVQNKTRLAAGLLLVEVGGVEPPSESAPFWALHAYLFAKSRRTAVQRAKRTVKPVCYVLTRADRQPRERSHDNDPTPTSMSTSGFGARP
jgi:hypothetical protein